MWPYFKKNYRRNKQFFLVGFCDSDLGNYYKTNFYLMYKHNFSLTELEDGMMPWEREIYTALLIEELNKKDE